MWSWATIIIFATTYCLNWLNQWKFSSVTMWEQFNNIWFPPWKLECTHYGFSNKTIIQAFCLAARTQNPSVKIQICSTCNLNTRIPNFKQSGTAKVWASNEFPQFQTAIKLVLTCTWANINHDIHNKNSHSRRDHI